MAANRMALVPVVVGVLLLLAQVEASDPGRLRRRLTKSIGADDEKGNTNNRGSSLYHESLHLLYYFHVH